MQIRSRPIAGAANALALALLTLLSACADPPTATPSISPAVVTAVTPSTELKVTQGFRKMVTLAGVRAHLEELQAIADASGGSAGIGGAGAIATEQYVFDRLQAAGFAVQFAPYDFVYNDDRTAPILQRISPNPLVFANGVDFMSMSYSGNGDATAVVQQVDLTIPSTGTTTSGCDAADFAGFIPGRIALVQRGFCPFAQKSQNAQAAGAVGVIIMNEGNTPERLGLLGGTLLEGSGVTIPVVGTTYAVGLELSNLTIAGDQVVRLRVDRVVEGRVARNVVAESDVGDPNRVVLVGAPMTNSDGGPGIVESSGAAALLDIAEAYAFSERTPRNRLRFVWFSGGTQGANAYASALPTEAVGRIAMMLSFEALGAPNFARLVYDGDQSTFSGSPTNPPGSGAIEQSLLDYFTSSALAVGAEAMPSNASPSLAFTGRGIPAGGLTTGTTQLKTAEQASLFGGTAGAALNPCYNLACDTMNNLSDTALDQMSDAAAHATLIFSRRNFTKAPLVTP
ncbi:MAG: M28 family metallopeptidase [Gemmatimonadota bacterium]